MNYPAREIEKKWQKWWQEKGLHKAPRLPGSRKYYVLEMYPYPSGKDLHMGHMKNYVIGDTIARTRMMQGYQVLHPMGWDAFGLPAENAAIKFKTHPKDWTDENIAGYRQTLHELGISYDWDRELATCWPDYYKWNQWLFLLLLRRGLAYRKAEYVNWCPSCQTVLANEQVIEGVCERCKTPVKKRKLEQWFVRITDYADRLLDDLDMIRDGWPDHIIKMQENWIGRSHGTNIVFRVQGSDLEISVFTTRADTVFGVTFLTVAPEWQHMQELLKLSPRKAEVQAYIDRALSKSDIERSATDKPKTGVDTGVFCVHPFTGERIPVFVGDYVLGGYGTGAVMGVPAHDQRDFEFAKKMGLAVKVVIKPDNGPAPDPKTMTEAFEDHGVMINSGSFNGLSTKEGCRAVAQELKELGLGGPGTSYRLRDWLISRQRYWGTPIPVVHCPKCGVVPVPEERLPVLLPRIDDYIPKGRSPLENSEEFMNTTCPKCGGPARRDPDTMDTFVDSSWYYLRYTDNKNDQRIFDPDVANAWMPVDQYIGGAEHATKHLIYARFIQKVLFDHGLVKDPEPFTRLFNQGLVQKKFYWCPECLRVVPDHEAEEHPHQLELKLEMMSKSRGNVVPVGPFIREHGVDVARITILFAGPPDKDMEWSDAGVEGARRFLNRVWRIYQEHPKSAVGFEPDTGNNQERQLYSQLQKTINAVRDDLESFGFNTAIARLMELFNAISGFKQKDSPAVSVCLEKAVLLLAPFAPHMAEELWHSWAGHDDSVFQNPLPEPDQRYLMEDTITIPVQVNGKLRAKLRMPRGSDEQAVFNAAVQDPNVGKHIAGKQVKKLVFVPDKLMNIVV